MGIPNILSIFRLVLAPVFAVVYLSGIKNAHIYAGIVYIVASVTDLLDGFIARKFNATSELGKILDPLGDKIITFTVLLCITVGGVIPIWVIVIYTIKELLMGIGSLIVQNRASSMPPSNLLGKSATVLLCIVCAALTIFTTIPQNIAVIMISVALAVTILALLSYANTFLKVVSESNGDRESDID